MARINFTKESLLALPTPDKGKRAVYLDTKTAGLQVRVTDTGAKTLSVYRRTKGGQPERITLGRFPAMAVEQARRLAAGINAQIEEGASPAEARRARRGEAMLINQATALQSIFANLTENAMRQSLMPNIEGFMRLALRAQNQCRATLETLATIKNPPIIYAKQLNQTTGPQQINNGATAPAHGRENEIDQNELTGGGNELLPDTRTSGDAGRAMQTRSTVEALNRP